MDGSIKRPQSTQVSNQNFEWDDTKAQAAELISRGRLRYQEIADQLQISIYQLYNWNRYPQFRAKIKEWVDGFEVAARDRYLATKFARLDALIARAVDIETIWIERGEMAMADTLFAKEAGGARTGHIVREFQGFGNGPFLEIHRKYSADVGLLKEYRATLDQIAVETGQKLDRHEVSGPNGGPIVIREVEILVPTLTDVAVESEVSAV